jgi:hypothetical protein
MGGVGVRSSCCRSKPSFADKKRHFEAAYGAFGVRTVEATGETDDITPLLRGRYDIGLRTSWRRARGRYVDNPVPLDTRILPIIAGESVPPSQVHNLYISLEAVLVLTLAAGILNIRRLESQCERREDRARRTGRRKDRDHRERENVVWTRGQLHRNLPMRKR